MSGYYLGVDGGQSSTVALVAQSDGQVIGYGVAGPCNHVSGEAARTRFQSVVGQCVADALRLGKLPPTTEFRVACLGFSGGAADKDNYCRELIRSLQLKITNDAEIALTGATGGEPGIIAIAGTGSIALGKNAGGATARAGGWGYIFGDEGGAFYLVREALRAALQYEEGWAKPTSLGEALLDKTGFASANDLLHHFYSQFDRKEIAALAPLVSTAADEGDSIARAILEHAASDLVKLVKAVWSNLFSERDALRIAYIGGVFRCELLRKAFVGSIQQETGIAPTEPLFSPAAGALIECLRLDSNPAKLSRLPQIKT